MTVARTFELITTCLVCMGSFSVWFLFWFSPACSCLCRFMSESGAPSSNPPRLHNFFAYGNAAHMPNEPPREWRHHREFLSERCRQAGRSPMPAPETGWCQVEGERPQALCM